MEIGTVDTRHFHRRQKLTGLETSAVNNHINIEELSIRFSCNAVDVNSGKEHVFTQGSLYKAIRASGSIPSVFIPAKAEKQHFIDGGVLNPVPISLISDPHAHAIVVVDTNALEEHYLEPSSKLTSKSHGLALPSWVRDYKGKMKAYFPEEKKKENQRSYSALELANRSFDLLQDRYCQMLLENYPVDAQIKIARKQCGTLEFHRAAELIEVGRIKTAAALDRMEHGN